MSSLKTSHSLAAGHREIDVKMNGVLHTHQLTLIVLEPLKCDEYIMTRVEVNSIGGNFMHGTRILVQSFEMRRS